LVIKHVWYLRERSNVLDIVFEEVTWIRAR